jgi:uncharacterized protein with von Willebrand factor type A (vWA) domain
MQNDNISSYLAYREEVEGDYPTPVSLVSPLNRRSDDETKTKQEEGTLSLQTLLESELITCGEVHKLWAMVKVTSAPKKIAKVIHIDFVVAIDRSSSMKMNNKLAFVQATLEFMISQLNESHRFCLITFNHEVTDITQGLLVMTEENKAKVRQCLKNIKAEGSTNISEALFTAISTLKERKHPESNRISTVMLFTGSL